MHGMVSTDPSQALRCIAGSIGAPNVDLDGFRHQWQDCDYHWSKLRDWQVTPSGSVCFELGTPGHEVNATQSDLCRDTALALSAKGANVVLAVRNEAAGHATASSIRQGNC